MFDSSASLSATPHTGDTPDVMAGHAPAQPPLPPQTRHLLDLLARAADAGAPCPSNFALMDALDLASPDGVRKHLAALRDAGLVRVESEGQRRRVTLLRSGTRTDWSRASGHARAGAAFSDGWGNGSDAILLRLADEGLDLATMATRLGRTPSSVRHRLRRLRAGRATQPSQSVATEDTRPPPAPPRPASVARDPGPMRRDVITNDPDRPANERSQIAAFLAAGKGRKVPPAYAGEVRGGTPLTGVAPISPMARRALLALGDTPMPARDLAVRARLDPLLVPEVLHELRGAGLVIRHRTSPASDGAQAAGPPRFARTPEALTLIETLGLKTAPQRETVSG